MGDRQEDVSKSGHEESHSGMDATTQDKDRHVEVDTIGNLDGDFEGDEREEELRDNEEGKVETTGEGQAPKPSRKRTRQVGDSCCMCHAINHVLSTMITFYSCFGYRVAISVIFLGMKYWNWYTFQPALLAAGLA